MNRSFLVIKLGWLAIGLTWFVISIVVAVTAGTDPDLIQPWGFDAIATVLFIVSIAILIVLEYNMILRFKEKPSGTIKMLLLTFPAMIGALVVSLVLELVFFTPFLGAFLNRTIFVFVVLGLFNWFLFIMEVFDGGLVYPNDGALSPVQFKKNWTGFILLVAMMATFLFFLAKSIWVPLTPVENALQMVPVLVIAILDLFSLLTKPLKIWRVASSRKERIGLFSLFSSGLVLVLFLATFILHTFAVSEMAPQDAYFARGAAYYIAMACLPAFSVLNFLGLVYPVKK